MESAFFSETRFTTDFLFNPVQGCFWNQSINMPYMSFIDLLNFNLLFNLALKNVSRMSNHGKINSFVETKRFFVTNYEVTLYYIFFIIGQ